MFEKETTLQLTKAPLPRFLLLQLIAGDDMLPSGSQDLDNIEEAAEAAAVESTAHQPNEYEIQRQRNIDRNKQMLADLKQKS